ncbi:MAG: arginine--tRNA ligase [Pyrinomonadaceae bacterium]
MKTLDLQETLRERVRRIALEKFNIKLDAIIAEIPPRTELGDLAFPVAFELAKRIKMERGEKLPPRSIAEELGLALENTEGVSRVEVAGAGYINVFYDRATFLHRFFHSLQTNGVSGEEKASASTASASDKIIVEHTNINPNKAAHIGHLRNAVLGDTFVRIMRTAGHRVEVQNYVDNTGVQVADVIVGFEHVEGMTLETVRKLDASLPPERPFDYYCWDLYARVGLFYRHGDANAKEDSERLRLRSETLRLIEEGDNPTADLAEYVATRVLDCHLNTMLRLGISYDVLPRESEILHLHFWDKAFERLRETNAIRYEAEGRNAGCWVMPTNFHASTDEHEADKIIVRSNGTVTYAGKDIAYQLWKLGRLRLDFYYKPFRRYPNDHIAWITTSDESKAVGANGSTPNFGGGGKIYNVIDSRQSYTQDIVRQGVAAVAPEVGANASIHLSYEMVALSPAACQELGIELSTEDQKRAYIEMSGRKGLGVKADDLITRLEMVAKVEVSERHPDLAEVDATATAHTIAVGALRYFLLKWTRNSVIAFDFKEALSFEGETGPYCQYAAVRANSIFRKLDDEVYAQATKFVSQTNEGDANAKITDVLGGESGDELWTMIALAARLDETIAQSAAQAEPAYLAKYAFQLARAFNLFYHRHRIIAEEDAARRSVLVAIADVARGQLTRSLATLGIQVPERM